MLFSIRQSIPPPRSNPLSLVLIADTTLFFSFQFPPHLRVPPPSFFPPRAFLPALRGFFLRPFRSRRCMLLATLLFQRLLFPLPHGALISNTTISHFCLLFLSASDLNGPSFFTGRFFASDPSFPARAQVSLVPIAPVPRCHFFPPHRFLASNLSLPSPSAQC